MLRSDNRTKIVIFIGSDEKFYGEIYLIKGNVKRCIKNIIFCWYERCGSSIMNIENFACLPIVDKPIWYQTI